MEDIIKELDEIITDRHLADKAIMLKKANEMDHELRNAEYDSYVEYSKQWHRLIDLLDLVDAYIAFKDRLEKVKNNIDYDKHH